MLLKNGFRLDICPPAKTTSQQHMDIDIDLPGEHWQIGACHKEIKSFNKRNPGAKGTTGIYLG